MIFSKEKLDQLVQERNKIQKILALEPNDTLNKARLSEIKAMLKAIFDVHCIIDEKCLDTDIDD